MFSFQTKLAAQSVGLLSVIVVSLACVSCIITVNIGGANRLTGVDRQRDRYSCYWDCDLVGCQISSDDDECAYDCEKICRPRYDWARSSSINGDTTASLTAKSDTGLNIDEKSTINMLSKLSGKSSGGLVASEPLAIHKGEPVVAATGNSEEKRPADGESVRLHLPRNANARKFAIWERCSAEDSTGKLKQHPFSY